MILQPQVRVDALRRLQGRGRAGLHQGVPGGDREDRDQGEDGPEVDGLVFYAKSMFYRYFLNSRLVTVVQKLEKYKPRPGASLESIT